jgi:EAL domain-containing protein (putative c-di-GMP-specific phosphodiesterase class I)
VDTVKIDRSLVTGIETDPSERRLVAAIIQLIAAVSLTPIAEGVETAEQAAQLRALGCPYGQGHHLGRPAEQLRPAVRQQLDLAGINHDDGLARTLRPQSNDFGHPARPRSSLGFSRSRT